MILYFSGTGNSEYAARALARQLGDEVVSLNQCMREKKARQFVSVKPYVIVAPIYISRLPLEVEHYLESCSFSGNQNVWFLVTCGGGMGGADHYCRKIADDKGLTYHGTGCIVMPNNYVVMFDVPNHEEAQRKAEEILPEVAQAAQHISNNEELKAEAKVKSMAWVSGCADFFHWIMMRDGSFKSSDKCIHCGKCEKVCPLGNIVLKDGRPVWNGTCMHCMACISLCPVQAIDYGNKTQKRNRYYINQQ
jgi:ferredoxin